MAAAALRNGISVLYACAYHLPVWRAGVAVTSAVIDADCKAGGTVPPQATTRLLLWGVMSTISMQPFGNRSFFPLYSLVSFLETASPVSLSLCTHKIYIY